MYYKTGTINKERVNNQNLQDKCLFIIFESTGNCFYTYGTDFRYLLHLYVFLTPV